MKEKIYVIYDGVVKYLVRATNLKEAKKKCLIPISREISHCSYDFEVSIDFLSKGDNFPVVNINL